MGNGKLQALAELAVKVGANVQPGQVVAIGGEIGKEHLVRAIAEEAYKAGASFVDAVYFDPYVKRARIAHATDEALEFIPDWHAYRMLQLGEQRAARIGLSGPVTPGVLDGLDPERSGRDRFPQLKESTQVLSARTTNWTIVPCPSQPWAELVHPDLDPEAALEKLWEQVAHICRLDTDDPQAAWMERRDQLISSADRLTERGFDALHYTGPGTDLTVGLLPGHRWVAGGMETVDGVQHMANLPTEEVFTSPDPERTSGTVTTSKPLVLIDGTVVRDMVVTFEAGRITELTASTAQDVMRTIIKTDEGAARLGEVALVDRQGRIGALDTVFYDTLLDENAASHLAIGMCFEFALSSDQQARGNRSEVHIDFMIGSPDLDVTGITADGERVPVLNGGDWKI